MLRFISLCEVKNYLRSSQQRTLITRADIKNALSVESKRQVIKRFKEVSPMPVRSRQGNAAAVLVPLCHVKGQPAVLFTLRAPRLLTFQGQVCFPGGKWDESSDSSLIDTALRETEEELGINRRDVEVWTNLPLLSDASRTFSVSPVIGEVKGDFDVTSLAFNQHEVAKVFSLSLEHLCNPVNKGYTRFHNAWVGPVFLNGPHKIWGLTARIMEMTLTELFKGQYVKGYS